jgi:hypothetical protein
VCHEKQFTIYDAVSECLDRSTLKQKEKSTCRNQPRSCIPRCSPMASHGAPTEVDRAAKASFDLFAETFSNWRTLASLGSEPVLRIVALGGASPLLSSLSQSDCPPQMHVDAAATLALLCGVEIARQDILQLQGLPRLLAVLQAQTLPDIALAHTLTAIINLSPCDTVLSSLCEQQAVAVCLRLLAHAHPAVVAQASLLLRVVAGDSQNCYAVFLAGTQLLRAVAHVLSRCSDGEALYVTPFPHCIIVTLCPGATAPSSRPRFTGRFHCSSNRRPRVCTSTGSSSPLTTNASPLSAK